MVDSLPSSATQCHFPPCERFSTLEKALSWSDQWLGWELYRRLSSTFIGFKILTFSSRGRIR